jgi:predicted PurR-regulated permease PerM
MKFTTLQTRHWHLVAAALIALLVLGSIALNLTPALIIGLAIFIWSSWLLTGLDRGRFGVIGKPLVVVLTLLLVIALGFLAQLGVQKAIGYVIVQGPDFLNQMQRLIEQLRTQLPPTWSGALPTDIRNFNGIGADTLRNYFSSLATLGGQGLHILFQVMLAIIVALAAALATRSPVTQPRGPLSQGLIERGDDFLKCFKALLGAQVYIALTNTLFTILYLYGILPLFDVILPFRELVCLLTFVLGLLPIVGNLIANTLLTVIALTHSILVAVISLAYLVTIHKLEYFINARLVGRRIKASVWELVCAMLLLEAIFGLAGLVLAPVIYAFVKMQLKRTGWI